MGRSLPLILHCTKDEEKEKIMLRQFIDINEHEKTYVDHVHALS